MSKNYQKLKHLKKLLADESKPKLKKTTEIKEQKTKG
jgi:hypothetical protein